MVSSGPPPLKGFGRIARGVLLASCARVSRGRVPTRTARRRIVCRWTRPHGPSDCAELSSRYGFRIAAARPRLPVRPVRSTGRTRLPIDALSSTMPYQPPTTRRRRAAAPVWLLVALTSLAGAGRADAQLLDERLVPGGRIRVSAIPSFTAWDQRFARPEEGSGRIDLGSDLSGASALGLYPGSGSLTDALRSISGDAAYAPTTGPVHGRVTHDVTRIDLGVHIGITDWLTMGAVRPRVKTRTMVDLAFMPDSVGGDLGLNPVLTDPAAVQVFLGSFAIAA